MTDFTIEQQRALALARARRRRAQAQGGNPPPQGMTAQQAAERDMVGAIAANNTPERQAQRIYQDAPIASGLASALRGVPFVGEFADEMTGAIFGEDAMRRQRLAAQGFEAANPTLSTAAQIGTGVAASIPMALAAGPAVLARAPASMLGKVAGGVGAGATAGGVEGAVSGFGAGNEGDRSESALVRGAVGAGLGGVVGGAAPLVAQGVSNMVRSIRGRPDAQELRGMGLSQESGEIVGRMLSNDDPARAAQRVRAAGPGGMIADAGPSTSGLLDATIQSAGPGGRIAREAIEARAGTAGRQMQAAMDDALGVPTAPAPTTYSAQTRQLYDAAYSAPIDYSGQAGRDLEALLPRVPGNIIARANRLMQVEGQKSGQILADVAEDGSATFRTMPDVRQLDYIKRALDDVARAGDGQGALGGNTAEGRAFKSLSRDIRSALSDAVPEYGQALSQAATEIGIRQARDLGESALRASTTRADLADELSVMGQAEVGALRRGVRTYLDDLLANVRRTATDPNMDAREGAKALSELSSRATRQKLEMILGREQSNRLMSQIDRASKAFELRGRVAEDSKTAARQAFQGTVRELSEPGVVGQLMQGSPVEATRRLVQSMTRMSPADRAAVEERIAAEIATFLTGPRGNDATRKAIALFRLLQRQPQTERIAAQAGRIAGTGVALGGYQTGMQSLDTPR